MNLEHVLVVALPRVLSLCDATYQVIYGLPPWHEKTSPNYFYM